MCKLTILTAGVALLSASAVFAQSSIDAPSDGRSVGDLSVHTRTTLPHTASVHAASSRASGRNRSSETCGRGVGPTIGHEPGAAVTGKSPAGPPASGAVDQHGVSGTGRPCQGRS